MMQLVKYFGVMRGLVWEVKVEQQKLRSNCEIYGRSFMLISIKDQPAILGEFCLINPWVFQYQQCNLIENPLASFRLL